MLLFLFLFCRQRYYNRCCWCPNRSYHFSAGLPGSGCWGLHVLLRMQPRPPTHRRQKCQGAPATPAPTTFTVTGCGWCINTPASSTLSRGYPFVRLHLRNGPCPMPHSFCTELNSSLIPAAAGLAMCPSLFVSSSLPYCSAPDVCGQTGAHNTGKTKQKYRSPDAQHLLTTWSKHSSKLSAWRRWPEKRRAQSAGQPERRGQHTTPVPPHETACTQICFWVSFWGHTIWGRKSVPEKPDNFVRCRHWLVAEGMPYYHLTHYMVNVILLC